MESLYNTPVGCVVEYNNVMFLCLGTTSQNKARLLLSDCKKYSGTPNLDKLTIVKRLRTTVYRDRLYIHTKQGIISASTGDIMSGLYTNELERLGDVWNPLGFQPYNNK